MLTMEELMTALSFGITCFSIGYNIGFNALKKSKK